ncbi:hypothetical protein ACWGNM_15690 [Streptomyces sp. NPDC055796]
MRRFRVWRRCRCSGRASTRRRTPAWRRHGDVVRIDAGPPGLRFELYCVFSAEGAQRVLACESANFHNANAFYQEVREFLGNGSLTSQDENYLRQRRLV